MDLQNGKKDTAIEERLLAALLTYNTIGEAADAVGITRPCIAQIMEGPQFVMAYAKARQQIIDRAVDLLQVCSQEAVATIRQELKAAKSTDRLRAAGLIMENVVRLSEARDIAQKLVELKEAINESNKAVFREDAGNPTSGLKRVPGITSDPTANGNGNGHPGSAPGGPAGGDAPSGNGPRPLADEIPDLDSESGDALL
jgi:hypothetical protein